jgi:hypothetical protein
MNGTSPEYAIKQITSFKRMGFSEPYTKEWGRIPYNILSKLVDRISFFYQESKFTIGFYFNKNIRGCGDVTLWGVGYNNYLVRFFRRATVNMYKKTPEKILPALIDDSKKIEESLSFILTQATLLERSCGGQTGRDFVPAIAKIFDNAHKSIKSYAWRDTVCTRQEPCTTQSMTETGKFLNV